MDGESSSSSPRIWNYDVYLSFRGEDTHDFISHLYFALIKQGLLTFMDEEEELMRGEEILPVLKGIIESRILIVVFSRNYAGSSWCLNEMTKIVECTVSGDQTVLPVFYGVDPSDVIKQQGAYGYSFYKQEERPGENSQRVYRWRDAMRKLASVSGWIVRNDLRMDGGDIDGIVKRVMRKLGYQESDGTDHLVGIQPRVEALEKLLDLGSDTVREVGICGMAGIGKTALAAAVYNRISHFFDASCFLSDVSRVFNRYGLSHLQEQLRQHLEKTSPRITGKMLTHLRVLIVFDDVDDIYILKEMAGNPSWFGAGSRIIITTRDNHILKLHGVDEVYRVELLEKNEALRLFCRRAFKCDYPKRDYTELTNSVLEYAKGLPFALVSLGNLFSPYQSISEWEIVLARLQNVPHKSIIQLLQTSLDGLSIMEKEIFLDMACFFIGEDIHHVTKILCNCGFAAESGIEVLINKSLMTISNQKIDMHDMLQKLGQEIVRKHESRVKPGTWSRLWLFNDFRQVIETNSGTKNVKAIVLNKDNPEDAMLRAEALSAFSSLRLLILRNVNFSGSLNSLSSELRHLSWYKYPFTYLPSSFEPYKLVELIMPDSNITQLWNDMKMLPNLRSMNLRDSRNLMKTPDFSMLPNLERLDFEGCIRLLQLDSSIAFLQNLEFLNLRNCNSLGSIPNKLFDLCDLEILNLAGCSKFAECFDLDPLPLLEEMGKPVLDCGINREHADLSTQDSDDVATQSERCAIQVPGLKSKSKAKNSQMRDAPEAKGKTSKAKTKVHLSKVKRHTASNTEATISNSIAKCVVALDKIDGVSNDSYMKALEKFKDPYWREIFLTMPCDRKKAWLDSLM